MILTSQAPVRISLFGGSTDIEPYASRFGGMTLSIAINLRQKVTMYSDNDIFNLVDNIFPYDSNPDLFYTIFKKYGIDGGHLTRVRSEFDGVIGAGIGSSASACVALLGAINERLQLGFTKHEIAKRAWEIEVNDMGWFGGRQDQYASVYGGCNLFTFGKDDHIFPLPKKTTEKLCQRLMLFYTGGSRKSRDIQKGFQKLTKKQTETLHKIKRIAEIAYGKLLEGKVDAVGELLHVSWLEKRKSNKGITNERIDKLYDKAQNAGAIGGKILGAGGCGYMVFFIPLRSQDSVQKALENEGCDWIPFYPDYQGLTVKKL